MRIACVHQGYELYGSDRSFIESVAALRAAFPDARIDVVLPRDGPIVAPLRALASDIAFEPLFVLRRRGLLRLIALSPILFPAALARAVRRFRSCDVVYINTTVVLDHILTARLFADRAIVHVHEIPEGRTMTVFRALLRWSRAHLIFNSKATKAAYDLPPTTGNDVIYNGIEGPLAACPSTYDGTRALRVLMLGRISRIKGQDVLIDAMAGLPPEIRARLDVRIVGSAFEDVAREEALAQSVRDKGLTGIVALSPFVSDPSDLYRWADIVTVPSCRPESLGRVAIEAMAFGRPPLASAIGGLQEIVVDGRTGWLVPPGRADALAEALRRIVERPQDWADFGAAARARYDSVFSAAAACAAIATLVSNKMSGKDVATALPVETDAARHRS